MMYPVQCTGMQQVVSFQHVTARPKYSISLVLISLEFHLIMFTISKEALEMKIRGAKVRGKVSKKVHLYSP